jgi:hypothetical protein
LIRERVLKYSLHGVKIVCRGELKQWLCREDYNGFTNPLSLFGGPSVNVEVWCKTGVGGQVNSLRKTSEMYNLQEMRGPKIYHVLEK